MAKDDKPDRGMVRYVGASTRRGLTVEDFESVGVTNQKADLWWDRSNRWAVPRADISDDAYERAIKPDPEFILVGGKDQESLSADDAEGRHGLAAGMTPMPPGPDKPDDYVGGGGAFTGTTGATVTGTTGNTGATGNTGGSATGSTDTA